MTPIALGVAAAFITLAGGMIALRLGAHLTLLMGVAAGIVLGIAIFDLLPESLALSGAVAGSRPAMLAVAVGFAIYLLLDRGLADLTAGLASRRHHFGPVTLTIHSMVDGLGIGLAFQLDTRVGWLIAVAVLAHDLADGVNTVGLCLAARTEIPARSWLIANSVAPLAGVLLSQLLRPEPRTLGLLLATFGGAFLYIGACELLPRSSAVDSGVRSAVAPLVGLALMAVVTGALP